ncbi:IDEAL domain-containing protein [Peribacillus loiseleuriae]|uniref:IDEAL domain-containing protein n=1 Tax=Peribacillus loiseleuriae TaxID=1679170 RepID=A0A0K9GYS5_9BACI|nr:IDEAL domain-containing protein [Peribacillus loiseleuriae]KMY51760.1 hypothetical protein AC625_21360 [Peribacillus loiseleuriae]
MLQHFIALKTFEHQIDCFCPGGEHAEILILNEGDIIEVTNERKFTMRGWYFLVSINNKNMFFMAHDDLEMYFMKEQILSVLDLDLHINYLQFKINEALDVGDETTFLNYTNKLIQSSELQAKLKMYLDAVEV